MTEQPNMNSIPGFSRAKKRIFLLVAILISLAVIELGSAIIFKILIPVAAKANIRALMGIGDFPVQNLSNSFWHHEFNPGHPNYKNNLNSKGTLGPDFSFEKSKAELRILCLGDSTVEGYGVEPDKTFPFYLEEILRENIHLLPEYRTVTVINGGVGSHNSAFSLAYLAFRLLHFNPEVVVIKSSYNDYLPYIVPGMTYDYTHAFPNPYYQIKSTSPYWSLARYSKFFQLVGIVLFRDEVAVPFRNFSGHLTKDQFQKMDISSNENKFFVFAENIRSMILLCRGRGMDVFIVDLPTSPNPDHFGKDRTFGIRYKDLIKRFESEEIRVAQEEEVTFIETGPFDHNDFWDHVHTTASGNRKIAESVAAVLLETIGACPSNGSRRVSSAGHPDARPGDAGDADRIVEEP